MSFASFAEENIRVATKLTETQGHHSWLIVWRDSSRDNVEDLSYQIEGKTLYTSACFVLVEVKQDKNRNSDWEGWSQANKPYKCLYTI